ncbi:MAG: glycosyltransferase family 9 protein [Chitinophagales bacterium]|nr:glycosyltransferase family 9 protein [Chitinophagales bacterium]
MKLLILRFSSIGDIVLTTPVIRCLRKKYPEAEIHYATKESFYPILQHNPYITKVHLLKRSFSDLIAELRAEKFDYIIDLHHNQRTFLLKLQLGVESFSFNKLNFEKWLLVNLKVNSLPQRHIVDRYLETCKALGVVDDGEGLDYFLADEDIVDIGLLPQQFHNGYAAWVIGAKQNTKKFPAEKIIRCLSFVKYPILLLGGREDETTGNYIAKQVASEKVYNACGKFTLNQSASLVQKAQFVISNDTGLMHIAAAFKKPIVSLWGNTVPAFGMYPYYGAKAVNHTSFQMLDLPCRPCSKLGYNECPKQHFNCMNLLDEEAIARRVNELIEQNVQAF